MPAALNQDFVTYKGDDISPIFIVKNQSGQPISIATVSEITWWAQNEGVDTTHVLTKLKSSGQITFVTDGTDGQFQVTLASADTQPLSGYYMHMARITDSGGNDTTVTVGRMQVGVEPSWTYNPAKLSTIPIYQVRRLIGDVLYSDQQMQDDELQFYIDTYGNVWAAAAAAARGLAAQFARLVDTVQGELRTLYGQRVKNYQMIAVSLDIQAKARSGSMVYAGAISQSDKESQVEDTDRVPPQFNIEMWDNLLPTAPVGHQTPGSPAAPGGF